MATISASQFLRGDPVVDVLGNEAHPEYKKTILPQPPKTSAFQGIGEAVAKGANALFPGVKPLLKGDIQGYKETIPKRDPVETAMNFVGMGSTKAVAKEAGEITLKSLERLATEVKTPHVSKQYISDLANRGDIKQPERDLLRSKLEEMTSSVGDLYTGGSKKVMEAFSRSGNQKSLGDFGGLKFEMGDFGNNSLLNKAASKDRFSPLEIPDALSNATHVFRASNNPSSYRFDNFVFLSPSEGGMKAVYTRENTKGALEVINAHSIPTEKVAKYLEDIGVSGQNRTGISNLEGSPSNPLTYGNKSSLADKLNSVKGDIKVNIKDFANKVKTELLPLKRNVPGRIKYESVTLPEELRGPVANYDEHVYDSPIKTSAGSVHWDSDNANYFAHSRIEDLPTEGTKLEHYLGNGKYETITSKGEPTRRVIEIQSDLFQKGRLGEELKSLAKQADETMPKETPTEMAARLTKAGFDKPYVDKTVKEFYETSKLEPYRNTWHERVIREEVKQAAKDGKTKLQFPTGETAMKIEGLGGNEGTSRWWDVERDPSGRDAFQLKPEHLKVGKSVYDGHSNWVITDVLGEGKFKAVPKETADKFAKGKIPRALYETGQESFDISGKVDTNNPIYKFYEKEVGRYLSKKYGAKIITDPQGVKWYELNVPKAAGNLPVEAFGLGALIKEKDEENQ